MKITFQNSCFSKICEQKCALILNLIWRTLANLTPNPNPNPNPNRNPNPNPSLILP